MHDPLSEDELTRLYFHKNLSAREIAERKGISHSVVKDRLTKYDMWGKCPAKYHLEEDGMASSLAGYPRWTHTGTGHRVRVHRLLIIAAGADPHEVFAGEKTVDHINGHNFDNRKENLRLLSMEEHGKKDGGRSENSYTHAEYLRALVSEPPEWVEDLPAECLPD